MAEIEKPKLSEEEEQSAEEQKKQKEQKEKEERESAERFNRQVNYFIMRYMWQVVCGRNPDDTIYMTFNMSRERYTRIINTGAVRYAKAELDSLSQITGLRKEIFTGEVRFRCPYREKKKDTEENGAKKKDVEIIEITEDEWKDLIQWRKARTGASGTQSPQDIICERLRKVKRSDVENWDFYRLCYFLKERTPAPSKVTKEQFRDMVQAVSGLSFSMLDKCEVAQLKGLQKLLQEKVRLVNGIIVYKEARAGEKKRK